MTVRELRELLSRFPDDAQVVEQRDGEHRLLTEDDVDPLLVEQIHLFDVGEVITIGEPIPEDVDLPWIMGCPGFVVLRSWG